MLLRRQPGKGRGAEVTVRQKRRAELSDRAKQLPCALEQAILLQAGEFDEPSRLGIEIRVRA